MKFLCAVTGGVAVARGDGADMGKLFGQERALLRVEFAAFGAAAVRL